MSPSSDCRLSPPLHLQIRAGRRHGQLITVREHLPAAPAEDPALPLAVITYHPGYAAGSYEDRDYFERLTPLLFASCRDCCRLRVFTVNHPGYDLPDGFKVDRHDLHMFSTRQQPGAIDQILRWLLLREFADEEELHLFAYGHSMGGLALARADMAALRMAVARQGRRAHLQKILSAPALVLQERARRNLRQLYALDRLKRTVGRVPLYELVAGSLFRGLSPILYRMAAESYSLNPDCSFMDFPRYNPFILLEQGLELLQLNFTPERLAELLHGSHLILSTDDRMVDSLALLDAARTANNSGSHVQVHHVDSSHNAERDDPELIMDVLCTILQPVRRGEPVTLI
jgi:hypothetical protein